MFIFSKSRKSDKDSYNRESQNFIPIACHYDPETLLTKNGELIQIIQINGICSEHISDKLFNLRSVVRKAISEVVESSRDCAFWLHTIRRKTNLDDPAKYDALLTANIHRMWQAKNFWHDKYVNTLYLSIVHDSPPIHINKMNAVINSLSQQTILKFHENAFDTALANLRSITETMLSGLKHYGARKLRVRFDGEEVFSEPLFLYGRIVHLKEEPIRLPIMDLSSFLASHKYAVGSDKIEVIERDHKKFAAVLSFKEYHEVSADLIDKFLQISVEMIATEIFYLTDKSELLPKYEWQNYIAGVSGDERLNEIRGITEIINLSKETNNAFCKQQISVSIIGENLEHLEASVSQASGELSEIGIVHVREDINLEQAFWAQLPGNFSFLRRLSHALVTNTGALASLHNFPVGKQSSKWGRAITIFRTERGTPYFLNLHSESGNSNNYIFGGVGSGKTVLTNFIISEATKYKAGLLYLSSDNSSEIFINAIGGTWIKIDRRNFNPLLIEDDQDAREFIKEFLLILSNHYIHNLSEQDIEFLNLLVEDLFSLALEDRNLSNLLSRTDFTKPGGEVMAERLAPFREGGKFAQIFDSKESIKLRQGEILGINLYNFSSEYFTKQFLPDDPKMHQEFLKDLSVNDAVRTALFYSYAHALITSGEIKKILAIDNLETIIHPINYKKLTDKLFSSLFKREGATICNLNLETLKKLDIDPNESFKLLESIGNYYILSSELKINDLAKLLNLTNVEAEKLSSFDPSARMFMVKDGENSVALELSLGGLPGVLRILSADSHDYELYQQMRSRFNSYETEWIEVLYAELNKTTGA